MGKQKPVGPLTGVLDLRSSPDQMPQGSLRMRLNMQTVGQGKLRRGSGWERLLPEANYNNSDFHDQLLSLSSASMRQPITLLYEATSTRKIRSLLIGTQGTIAQLNAHSGNYRILGSGFGGTPSALASAPRFKADRVGDYVMFTNDFDKPQILGLEQAADPATGKFLSTPEDLDTIGLSRAACVWSWKNVMFLANVEMDGERAAYRMVWSNYNDPTSWDPAKLDSIAGFKDLETDEEILAGAPAGDAFLIYTTKNIWEMIAVGGEESFKVRRVYNGQKDDLKGVLAFPNTLVNLHDTHLYLGHDGIYIFSLYLGAPDRPEYIHLGSSDLFDKIDSSLCSVHVAAVYGDEVLISVARKDAVNDCPDYTLRINKTYKVVDVVDAGWTALAQFSPQDVATIRDFIVENNLCSIAGLAAQGFAYGPEGLPRVLPANLAPFTPDHFYTDVTQTIADAGGDFPVEDWNQGSPSIHSLCSLVGGEILTELCRECKPSPLLIGANSVDWCLKQLGGVFYRERCVNPSAVGTTDGTGYTAAVASYLLDGYDSLLRFAPVFGVDELVQMDQVQLDFVPKPQDVPLTIGLRVAISAQPADSNSDTALVWRQFSSIPLAYNTSRTSAQHLADGTMPTETSHWHLWIQGRFIYLEFKISGVGGDAIFSAVEPSLGSTGQTINF